ncbi:4-hydroxy-3-methylbut-2-enyl diphosphate reductase [candidate division KSB1 bacterium]|nr:4-hydroxy-3-methylbut-2-enyl diphosphate reductase [candidate division KSB1 bacterium]
MKIVIDENAGPCPGVKRAIRLAEKNLMRSSPLYALGPIIHNKPELERLSKKGLDILDQAEIENGDNLEKIYHKNLFIRSHGISPQLERRLEENHAQLIDATCGKVKRVQKVIQNYYRKGYQIVIAGKKGHPEVVGLLGYCDNNGIVISDTAEMSRIDPLKKTLLVSQTTLSKTKFNEIREKLLTLIENPVINDTICKHINGRHEQLAQFANSVDVLLLIGGKESSNTGVLFDICKKENPDSYRIESPAEIEKKWFHTDDLVGITGSASTPLWQLEAVSTFLKSSL